MEADKSTTVPVLNGRYFPSLENSGAGDICEEENQGRTKIADGR